jgi:CRISPR/Cas system CSM-associated protein Csm4 (group 5 of RAMP superfamily)
MAFIEVRLRPTGPWRVGHRAGDRERVDMVYHSDALYSAVTHAMRALGWLDEWLDATARANGNPAVRFSSLFPFIGKTRLITPPRTSWPRANRGKLYLEGAKLVPLDVALGGPVDESRWAVDGASECLIPAGANAPFQVSMRSAAAVDRLTGVVEPHRTACLEFASNAGWWGVFECDDSWTGRVKSAFRLLADSGFGGERSRGWGRAGAPEFSDASRLFPRSDANGSWWLVSLYSPHESDSVDWSKGEYSVAVRGGWTDSPSGSALKKQARLVEEGSVLVAASLRGRTVDVAPEGFAHPVYRSGIALAFPLPKVRQATPPVEPAEEGAEQAVPLAAEPAAEAAEPSPAAEAATAEPEAPVVTAEPHVEQAVPLATEFVGPAAEVTTAEPEASAVPSENNVEQPAPPAAEPETHAEPAAPENKPTEVEE